MFRNREDRFVRKLRKLDQRINKVFRLMDALKFPYHKYDLLARFALAYNNARIFGEAEYLCQVLSTDIWSGLGRDMEGKGQELQEAFDLAERMIDVDNVQFCINVLYSRVKPILEEWLKVIDKYIKGEI